MNIYLAETMVDGLDWTGLDWTGHVDIGLVQKIKGCELGRIYVWVRQATVLGITSNTVSVRPPHWKVKCIFYEACPESKDRKVLNMYNIINHLTPNDHFSGRTAPLISRCCILYIYSTNIRTEYFKHAAYSLFFPLQNAVYFIMQPFLVPVLFTF